MTGGRQRPSFLCGTVLAGVVALVGCLIAPAASYGLIARTAYTITPNSNGLYVASVHCLPDEHVVSGGFDGSLGSPVVASKRTGPGGWKAVATGGPELDVYAYCTQGGSALSAHASPAKTVKNGGSRTASGTAKCAPGEAAVSGGYETLKASAGHKELEAFASLRASKDAWRVSVGNYANDANFRVFAYCRNHGVPKERSTASGPIAQNGTDGATAQCEPGEHLLSGGYATSPRTDISDTSGPNLLYYDSFAQGTTGWSAYAHNFGTTGTVTAVAYCS